MLHFHQFLWHGPQPADSPQKNFCFSLRADKVSFIDRSLHMEEEKAIKYCHQWQNFCFWNLYHANDIFYKTLSSVCSSWGCSECQQFSQMFKQYFSVYQISKNTPKLACQLHYWFHFTTVLRACSSGHLNINSRKQTPKFKNEFCYGCAATSWASDEIIRFCYQG